ncbi:alginate lyase family protein [Paenibacillus aurantius]
MDRGDYNSSLSRGAWFSDYLQWISTHLNGRKEMNERNNHSVCWFVQAASFGVFTENQSMMELCRESYKHTLLPEQMAEDGSFPHELCRTKPYSYSNFVLDNMVTLCHILSTPADNLWEYTLPDGRSIRKGMEFLFPYLTDKDSWPYQQDIEHYEDWPVGMSYPLFAGLAWGKEEYVNLWRHLEQSPTNEEVRRNMAIRQPLLWVID